MKINRAEIDLIAVKINVIVWILVSARFLAVKRSDNTSGWGVGGGLTLSASNLNGGSYSWCNVVLTLNQFYRPHSRGCGRLEARKMLSRHLEFRVHDHVLSCAIRPAGFTRDV